MLMHTLFTPNSMPKKEPTKKTAKIEKPVEKKEKREQLQAPRGMRDILPAEHAYFTVIKKVVRHRGRQAGFRRISTPILEDKRLIVRGIGEGTDIVEKEMYSLTTKGGTELVMKPEGTAAICRAYLENGLHQLPKPVELYYIEPHFRHDRPQKGRFRQFHQAGFEVIGELDPAIDAQNIALAAQILKDLKIYDGLSLQINTIGDSEDRKKYESALRDFYTGKERNLPEDIRHLVETNPLRLLDQKDEDAIILAKLAPKFDQFLGAEAKEYHEKVCELLDAVGVTYVQNPKLVRGLDYYNRTVFEFVDEQGLTLAAGGRYDGLMELLGGAATPAFGWAAGMERMMDRMKDRKILAPDKDTVDVFVVQLGWEPKKKAMQLLTELRNLGVHAMGAIGKASMKAQLEKADKFDALYALILGEAEVREGQAIIRDMRAGKQEIVPLNAVVREIILKLGDELLDVYDPSDELEMDETRRPEDELLIRE